MYLDTAVLVKLLVREPIRTTRIRMSWLSELYMPCRFSTSLSGMVGDG